MSSLPSAFAARADGAAVVLASGASSPAPRSAADSDRTVVAERHPRLPIASAEPSETMARGPLTMPPFTISAALFTRIAADWRVARPLLAPCASRSPQVRKSVVGEQQGI